jgi:hypothetical protein
MSVNSLSKRSSSVAQEDLNAKPPLAGSFAHLPLPRGDESMLDVCADIIADADVGINGIDPNDLRSACLVCDDHGRDVKNFQETRPGAVRSRLSISLVAALALYTAEFAGVSPYGACNAALRSADRSKCKPYIRFIWFLMHALAKCEQYVGGNVYRGVKADLRSQYPRDREVTWFQFSSCTCDIEVEQSEQFLGSSGTRTLFSIELTTGRARVITKFSLAPSEAEVLLPPNSRFSVLGQLDAGNGLIIITLKELPSRDPIIDFGPVLTSASAAALPASNFKLVTLPTRAGKLLFVPKSGSSFAALAPVTIVAAVDWLSLLRDFRAAVSPEAIATIIYYRNMSFAAALCRECSDAEAAEANSTNAAHYAAASKTLYNIVACEGSPSSADTLSNLLAQAQLAVPQIEEAQSAAAAAKDFPKATELQLMRASIMRLASEADDVLKSKPSYPATASLLSFSLPLLRHTNKFGLSKTWVQRHFVLSGRRLYHADGDNGFPNSRDGTLAFVRSKPPLSKRHCLDLGGCTVAACSTVVDGQAFAFEIKFPLALPLPGFLHFLREGTSHPADDRAHKNVFLAAADDVTRQRCVRMIEAASESRYSSSLRDIASSVALTRGLLDTKSVSAVKAVLEALGVALDHPSLENLGFDLPSLKAADFDVTSFRAAGCDWSTIRTAGFSAAEARSAGCDLASAQAAGYGAPLLLDAYGYDVVKAAGVDLSSFILVSFTLCTCTHVYARTDFSPPRTLTSPSARWLQLVHDPASSQSR